MSKSSIELTNRARIITEQLSQVEGETTRTVHAYGTHSLPVGAMPRCQVETTADMVAAAATYDITPTDPAIYRIEELRMMMSTAAAVEMDAFGNLSALSNGITIKVRDADGDVYSVIDTAIKSLNDLALYGDLKLFEQSASFTALWVFKPATPIRLEGGDGEYLRIETLDSLATHSGTIFMAAKYGIENTRS